MTEEAISFGSGDAPAPARARRLGWQAPLVLALALLVVLGAAGGGVALGRQEPSTQASGSVLTPYYAWSELMSALSDQAAPPGGATTEAATINAIRAYVDRFREPSARFHRALDADDGPYNFYEFPNGSPSRASLVALDGAISRYVVAIDGALAATTTCIDDGRSAATCVEENLGQSTPVLTAAAGEVESAYRAVVQQATDPSDFLG